jgi:membrane protease YdiL (CAAX protease family)
METKQIEIKTFLICLVAISCIEGARWLAVSRIHWNEMVLLGLARLLEIGLIFLIVWVHGNGLHSIGLKASQISTGIKKGIIWSAGFGVLVFSTFLFLFLFEIDPLALIRTPLPSEQIDILILFAVGGIIAPIAEEVFFRGILYGFFRKWGVSLAIALSTFLFVLPHLGSSDLPITQIIGGVVFAVAYEIEKNLMVPIMIHAFGNMAIFCFSLLP